MSTPPVETWWELPSSDLDVSARFYRDVFGWDAESMGDDYRILKVDESMIGGLFAKDAGEIGAGIQLMIGVADLEATLARIEAAGGTVTQARTEIGNDFGWWAEFREPGGLTLGLSSMNPV